MNAAKIIKKDENGDTKIVWEVADSDFHRLLSSKKEASKRITKHRLRLDSLKHHYRDRINKKIKEIDILIEKLTK